MKEYGYFQAMFMSFYSTRLYRDVARNWGAGVVLYLFILLFLCWAVLMFKYQPAINVAFTGWVNKFQTQIPEVNIKKGIVTTPENKPYLIKDPDDNKTIVIIDTSGEYKDMTNVPEGTAVLVTKDTTYYLDNDKTVKIKKIPENLTLDIQPEKIGKSAEKFVGWSWVLILPVMLILSLIYRLVLALLYGVIGKILAALSGAKLNYGEVYKLAVITMTPAIVLATVLDFLGVNIPFEWLICFILSMIYLTIAINANKNVV